MEQRRSKAQTGSKRIDTRDEDVHLDQIVERLGWTPGERLRYLLDMLAFEERARQAKRVGR
jgi:hypothetical protein